MDAGHVLLQDVPRWLLRSPCRAVAAVQAAVSTGTKALEAVGKLVAAPVIARRHADLLGLLPK